MMKNKNGKKRVERAFELPDLIHQYEKEIQLWNALFRAVENFHSNNDVEKILTEILRVVQTFYTDCEIELFLSQDLHNCGLPAKLLTIQDDVERLCTRAFLEGTLLLDEEENGKSSSIAIPLCGKQGSYGVLQLQRAGGRFDDLDVQFLSKLCDSAGTAFENAKLYEHTNMLVRELRLINEITRRLNQSLQARDIVYFAAEELLKIFDADYSCILKYEKENNRFVVQASNLPAMIEEEFHPDYGYTGIVFKSKEALIVADYETEKVESILMELTGSRSLIASPIIVKSEVIGVVLVTHREVNHFSYENFKLIQVLSGHIGLALTNASLHAEVRRMAITDHLTGLYARHYLNEQISFYQKKDRCGTLILVDIDHFKQINDTYGHQVGDKILLQVSQIIQSSIRDTDIAARWGGEELALYLPQSLIDHAVRVAERIRLRIANETDPAVTISCGVSQWNWDDKKVSVEHLFYRADMALYEAKRNGRNQVRISQFDLE